MLSWFAGCWGHHKQQKGHLVPVFQEHTLPWATRALISPVSTPASQSIMLQFLIKASLWWYLYPGNPAVYFLKHKLKAWRRKRLMVVITEAGLLTMCSCPSIYNGLHDIHTHNKTAKKIPVYSKCCQGCETTRNWYIAAENANTPVWHSNPIPGTYPKEMKIHVYTKTAYECLIAALFMIAPSWKQPDCPSLH